MEEGEGSGRRYRRNLQGLLQFAVDHNDDPSAFQEMSEEVHN